MKIYPSNHVIRETNRITYFDIPLSYIDAENMARTVNVVKESGFSMASEQEVHACDEFISSTSYLFDDSGRRVNCVMQNNSSRYAYMPDNAIEFQPTKFLFSVLIKKNMKFTNDQFYNIKAGAISKSASDTTILQKLMSVFGDAPERGICPSNIAVNHKSMELSSLIHSSFADNDIVFIESTDGKQIGGNPINFDQAFFAVNTCPCLIVDTFETMQAKTPTEVKLQTPILYGDIAHSVAGYVFDLNSEISFLPKSDYNYINLFTDNCPILLVERKKAGYAIVMHKSFITQIDKYSKLFYEILMWVYLRNYYKTPLTANWITDKPVDYLAYQKNKYNLHHGIANINTMLAARNPNIGNEYQIVDVVFNSTAVILLNVLPNGDLLFAKTKAAIADPKKEDGYISVFTPKQSVIQYKQRVIKRLETGITVQTDTSGIYPVLTVLPCKSTNYEIDTDLYTTLTISDITKKYYLCCKNSVFSLVTSKDYDSSKHGMKTATVSVSTAVNTYQYDIRVLGGGLPAKEAPDYDLLDIGHINGRPVRLGGTLIIHLPRRLENHQQKIEEAVSQHIAAGEYPIFLFDLEE